MKNFKKNFDLFIIKDLAACTEAEAHMLGITDTDVRTAGTKDPVRIFVVKPGALEIRSAPIF